MKINLSTYPQLQSVLRQDKPIVYLCGAGLSMALGGHEYGWENWIAAARGYMSAAESSELKSLLNLPAENALIKAAGYALQKTKQHETYHDYMNATIGSLAVSNNSLASSFQAINRCGDYIATTNYDLLIEQATGLDSYTYTQSGDILKALKGDAERKVIHLHGLYDPDCGVDDIIADSNQYNSIIANQGAQFIQNLLSTNTIIVIGCGATLDDPNLAGFLSFTQKQLGMSVPYFYLCKGNASGAGIALPDNSIPIFYGDNYNNLSGFLNEIVLYRINHLAFSEAIRVNPYADSEKKGSAYGRLHFSNEFSRFTGRMDELEKLNAFISYDQALCWWAVTGEGGYGKSRLLLEWLKRLPNDWFGFFGETNLESINEYDKFKPFNNTVIVLDYILGNESACARIISTMYMNFAETPYKLRIVLVDRFYNDNKIGWHDTLLNGLKPQAKVKFIGNCYSGERLVPLQIGRLLDCDERKHIENYLRSYIEILDNTAGRKYAACLEETASLIYEKFCSSLGWEYRRPLFFNIYVEVWISKGGMLDVQNARDLLGQFLEKEAKRWFLRLRGDKQLLYAYQILLAFAAASQLYVLQDELGIYREYSERLLRFVESEKVAGKRKKSLDDLFMYQEYVRDSERAGEPPVQLTILSPEYPDIILEFIVDYYIDSECWIAFAQEVRDYENVWFNMFLVRGMEDFPDTEAFVEMYFAPLKDPKDTFGFTIAALSYVREFAERGKLSGIVDTLSTAGMSKEFGVFELELWRRISVVYSERQEYERLHLAGFQFADFIRQRKHISAVIENAPEVIEGFCSELLNAQQFEFCAKLVGRFDKIAYDGYIATVCSSAYYHLINNQIHYGCTENLTAHLKGIFQHLSSYSEDDDIIDYFVNATDQISEVIRRNDDVALLNRLVPIVEKAYDRSSNQRIAEVLAISEASRFFNSIADDNLRLAHKSHKRVDDLFQIYANNEDVIYAYASVTSFTLLEKLKQISDTELNQFKSWKDRYPERVCFLEAYGRVLLVKWFNMTDACEEESAKPIFKEIEDVARILSEQHEKPELLYRTQLVRGMGCYSDYYDL